MSNDNTKVEYYRKLLDEALANSEPEPPFVHLPGCTFGGERYCMWCEPCNMAWNAAIDAAREAVRHALGPMEANDPGQRDAALAAIDALREQP